MKPLSAASASYGGGAAQIITGRVSSSTPMAAIDVIILWMA